MVDVGGACLSTHTNTHFPSSSKLPLSPDTRLDVLSNAIGSYYPLPFVHPPGARELRMASTSGCAHAAPHFHDPFFISWAHCLPDTNTTIELSP